MSHKKKSLIIFILVLASAIAMLPSCGKLKLKGNKLFGNDTKIIDNIDWMRIGEVWNDSEFKEFFSTNDKKEIAKVIEMFNGWDMDPDPDLAIDGPPDYEIRFGDKVIIGYFRDLGGKTAVIGNGQYYELPDAFVDYLNTHLPKYD